LSTGARRAEGCDKREREERAALCHFKVGVVLTLSLAITVFLLLIVGGPRFTTAAQETKQEGVAACGDCHTPRKPNGELDYHRWLAGASAPYLSARPQPDWPIIVPRLAGLPPASDAQMITLLTTGIWVTGNRFAPRYRAFI
jgi:hypothetical protein